MPDTLTITLTAVTMEGVPAHDPSATVLLMQTSEPQSVLATWTFAYDAPKVLTFPLPEDTFPTWQVSVAFTRFDAGSHGTILFQPRGQHTVAMNVAVVRLPGKWTPNFSGLANLVSPRFNPFRAVVARSTAVDLLVDASSLGDLSVTYDTLASQPQTLAKMALLNLFSVLTEYTDPVPVVPAGGGGVAWFSYVRKVVRIGQERFLAEVDPTLFESVHTLVHSPGLVYKGVQYATEADGGRALHTGNIPAFYLAEGTLQQMETVKIAYEQGNVQLTVSYITLGGVATHLLDCDMDEHLNLIQHGFDVLKHLFNGGTSPVTMHEYIVRDSAQRAANGVSTVDLGYQLA